MNNCKGFTLIEVITSLMILTIVSSALFPILKTIYDERTSIQQEQVALSLLNQAITEWLYDDISFEKKEIIYENVKYTLSFANIDQSYNKVCIHWRGANKRIYERCESGKR